MNPENFIQKVVSAYSHIADPRIKQLIQSLIKYLHHYVIENQITEKEWEFTWNFMAKIAEFTDENRNEFLLLADVLGISQLVEMINHQRGKNEVGYALVGPFYRANAPFRVRGASIVTDNALRMRVKISGKVVDITTGKPIAYAMLDVWQAAANGLYESQDRNQPEMNLRGRFKTDKKGTYELVALMPTPYPVPTDGPAGELLKMANRHPLRPAHIHFIVSSPNFATLVTQIFVAGDDLIDTDAVFTANENMIGNFIKQGDHYMLHYDFQLNPGESIYPEAPIK